MYRQPQISPEHAQAMVDDFYAFFAKMRTKFCAVHFAGATEKEKPLVIVPPKGVSAHVYKRALLLQAESGDHAALRMADEKFRAHINEALGESSGSRSEKTITRAVVDVVTACNLKL